MQRVCLSMVLPLIYRWKKKIRSPFLFHCSSQRSGGDIQGDDNVMWKIIIPLCSVVVRPCFEHLLDEWQNPRNDIWYPHNFTPAQIRLCVCVCSIAYTIHRRARHRETESQVKNCLLVKNLCIKDLLFTIKRLISRPPIALEHWWGSASLQLHLSARISIYTLQFNQNTELNCSHRCSCVHLQTCIIEMVFVG